MVNSASEHSSVPRLLSYLIHHLKRRRECLSQIPFQRCRQYTMPLMTLGKHFESSIMLLLWIFAQTISVYPSAADWRLLTLRLRPTSNVCLVSLLVIYSCTRISQFTPQFLAHSSNIRIPISTDNVYLDLIDRSSQSDDEMVHTDLDEAPLDQHSSCTDFELWVSLFVFSFGTNEITTIITHSIQISQYEYILVMYFDIQDPNPIISARRRVLR